MLASHVYGAASILPSGHVLVEGTNANNSVAEIYDWTTGWISAGTTATQRVGSTATLLPNNTVLVVGGGSSLASAELYVPCGVQ
jgi:hypothetical protein